MNLSESLEGGEVILRTYDRFIAEFLNEDSPVHLRLLASPTCVGFRYGRYFVSSRGFSRQDAGQSRLTNQASDGSWDNATRICLCRALNLSM